MKDKTDMRIICLMCKTELTDREMASGFGVCDSCRLYYFPEKKIYYRADGQPGPEIIVGCDRPQAPKRLAKIKTPPLWIPMTGCFDLY